MIYNCYEFPLLLVTRCLDLGPRATRRVSQQDLRAILPLGGLSETEKGCARWSCGLAHMARVELELELELELIHPIWHYGTEASASGWSGGACVAREVSAERGGMGERGCARRLGGDNKKPASSHSFMSKISTG